MFNIALLGEAQSLRWAKHTICVERSALGETQFLLSEERWAKHTNSVERRALGEAHNFRRAISVERSVLGEAHNFR